MLPIPTAIKLAEGNPGKQKICTKEPKPSALASLKAPAFLNEEAKMLWDAIAPEFQSLGLLTVADKTKFGDYCRLIVQANTLPFRRCRIRWPTVPPSWRKRSGRLSVKRKSYSRKQLRRRR